MPGSPRTTSAAALPATHAFEQLVEHLALGAASAQRLEPASKRLLTHVGELRHPRMGAREPSIPAVRRVALGRG